MQEDTDHEDDEAGGQRDEAISAAEVAVLMAADELAEAIGCDQAEAMNLIVQRLRDSGHMS